MALCYKEAMRAATNWIAVCAAAALLALTSRESPCSPPAVARAARPLRLDYAVAPSCPDASHFLRQVAARAGPMRMAQPGESASALSVTIRSEAGKSEGEIRIDAEPPRRLGGPTCASVVEGLALVAALMLGSNAGQAAVPAAHSEPAAPAPVDAPSAATNPDATPHRESPRPARWGTGLD